MDFLFFILSVTSSFKTKTAETKILRQSGGPAVAGSMTLRPRFTTGLPFQVFVQIYSLGSTAKGMYA
jgi:hypothetical protein